MNAVATTLSLEEALSQWNKLNSGLAENLVARGRILQELHRSAPYIYDRFLAEVGITEEAGKRLMLLNDYPTLARLSWRGPEMMLRAAGRLMKAPDAKILQRSFTVRRPTPKGGYEEVEVTPEKMNSKELEEHLLPALAPKGDDKQKGPEIRTIIARCPSCGESFNITDRA